MPIAVTEFNSAYDKSVSGEATPDSHYNAIWVADVLGRMIKNGVFMANHWTLTSKGGSGGWGLVGAYEVYPTYYVYQLYKMFGNELVYSSSDDPDLSIYAARRADGALTVIVINLSAKEKTKAIRIEDQATSPGGGVVVRCESQGGKCRGVGHIQWHQRSATIHDPVCHSAGAIKIE